MNPIPNHSKGQALLAASFCWATFAMGVLYALVTAAGFLSLSSPDSPIGQPYLAIMEICILIISPLMLISVGAVYVFAERQNKLASLAATGFMLITTAITSCVHLTILLMGPDSQAQNPSLLSFRWPSVVYVLDILAWDWFFGVSMLFLSIVFWKKSKGLGLLMLISAIFSLAGLAGIFNGNMSIRNIGIIGYGVLAPIVFLRLGFWFRSK